MKKQKKKDGAVVRRSGNIYSQLGLPNPVERQVKSRLMHEINDSVARAGLSLNEAAERVELDEADMSRIFHGQGSGLSVERLSAILELLRRT